MNRSFVALSISSGEIKIAEITQENGEKLIRTLQHLRAPVHNRTQTSDLIRHLIQECSLKTRSALLVISSEEVNYREFSFPFDSPRKVMSAIRFETSSEYPSEEYLFDPIEVISGDPDRKAFLVAIVRKDSLRERIRDAEAAGLRIIGITCDLSPLGSYFADENDALVMDVGERQTLFVLYSHAVPVLVRSIPIGLRDIGTKEAESSQEGLKSLAGEIKRTTLSFVSRTGLDLDRVYIAGGLLKHKSIISALKGVGNFRYIDGPPEFTEFKIKERNADPNLYAALLGAFRWKKGTKAFDFYRDEFVQADSTVLWRKLMNWGILLLLSLMCAVLLSSWLKIFTLHKREKFLTAETRQVFTATFPQVKKIVDEVRQARNLVESKKAGLAEGTLSPSVSILEVMEQMSLAIPKEINFQIVNLFWERGRAEIDGRTDSFKTVNRIQELLSKSQRFPDVMISNAKTRSDNQNVEFKITIRIAG